MKNLSRFFLIMVLIGVSSVCKAQIFTATEFINLAFRNQENVQNALEDKGYQFSETITSDMSENDVFVSGDMRVIVVYPTFENAQSLLTWEFPNSSSLYNDLGRQISDLGFDKFYTERRTGFVATTYQRPGFTVTLSTNTSNNPSVSNLSVRYTSLSGLAGAMDR